MSIATKELTVTVLTTPKELREAAAFLETEMEKRTLGEEVPAFSFFGEELRVKLMANQSAYHNHKSGNKSSWT